MTNNKGITLIALVITIIVLLILAGVSIAMLTGENGILTRANDSTLATSRAEVAERVNMELSAQLANAMAGEAFDSQTEINTNLGTVDGYTIQATVSGTGYSVDNTVSIKITATDGDTAMNQTRTVEYNDTDNVWEMDPVVIPANS